MSVVIVVRNNSNGLQLILNGPITPRKIDKIKVACGLKKSRGIQEWKPKELKYLVNNYKKQPVFYTAKKLTEIRGKIITKNMCISKYNTLKRKNRLKDYE